MPSGKGKRKPQRDAVSLKTKPSGALPAAANSHERVCWRFTHVDHDGRWGFNTVTSDVLCEVLRKLAHCETMTVGELKASRRFFKEYDLPQGIIPEAMNRLVEMGRDDMTAIQRLEFTGTQRLYGFLDGNIFHVVWWDPEHEVCPSKLKHT